MKKHARTGLGGSWARWMGTAGPGAAAVLLALCLGACGQEPAGTAEQAGKKIDEAVAAAQDSAEEAAEKVKQAAEQTADQAKQAAADVASAAEKAAGEVKEKLEEEKAAQ